LEYFEREKVNYYSFDHTKAGQIKITTP